MKKSAKKLTNKAKRLGAALILTSAQRGLEKSRSSLLKGLEEVMKTELQGSPPHVKEKKLEEALGWLLEADPVAVRTKGDKLPYARHVLRWLKSGTVRLPEDTENIRDVLSQYGELRNHSTSTVVKRSDMQQFDSPAAVLRFLRENGVAESSDEVVDADVPGGYEVADKSIYDKLEKVFEQGPIKLYKIKQSDQSIVRQFPEWMKTRWCIKSNLSMYKGDYHLVTYKDRVFALIHVGTEQIKDVEDHLLSPQQLKAIAPAIKFLWPNPPSTGESGMELHHFFEGYEKNMRKKFESVPLLDFLYWFKLNNKRMSQLLISEGSTDFKRAAPSVYDPKPTGEKRQPVLDRLERVTHKNPVDLMLIAYYAKEHGLWNDIAAKAKAVARQDPELAVLYAYLVENRFESAEPIIMTQPMAAADYATIILGKPWPEAEAVIKRDPIAWEIYSRKFKKKQ